MTSDSVPPLRLPHQGRQALWAVLVGVTVTLPWINPYSTGPRANTIPLLFSAACALALLVAYGALQRGTCVGNPCQPRPVLVAWLAAALWSFNLSRTQAPAVMIADMTKT